MEEKHFKNTVRNYILLTVLIVPIILLTILIFAPLVLERFGLLQNYESYLNIASPAITFLSIVVTGAIAIYIMEKNHKHTEKVEQEKNDNHFKNVDRVFWRTFNQINIILKGYNNYFYGLVNEIMKEPITYKQNIVKQVSDNLKKDLNYIDLLLIELLKLEYKFDMEFEQKTLNTVNVITNHLRNIRLELNLLDSEVEIKNPEMYTKISVDLLRYKKIFESLNAININLEIYRFK